MNYKKDIMMEKIITVNSKSNLRMRIRILWFDESDRLKIFIIYNKVSYTDIKQHFLHKYGITKNQFKKLFKKYNLTELFGKITGLEI